MSEKVYANWGVNMYVDCPHCNSYIDVFTQFQEQEMFEVLDVCENKDISDYDFKVECEDCKKEFKITDVQY